MNKKHIINKRGGILSLIGGIVVIIVIVLWLFR